MMGRKKTPRDPTPKEEGAQIIEQAAKAGAEYARDQVSGDYFRDWVLDQLHEAEEMRKRDPNSVLPLETPADAKKLARNMLQQLEWDTKRQLDGREILQLAGAKGVFDSGSKDWVRDHYGITFEDVSGAFFDAFVEELQSPSTRDWLVDIILERIEDVRGVPKSKVTHPRESRGHARARETDHTRRTTSDLLQFVIDRGGSVGRDQLRRGGWTDNLASAAVHAGMLRWNSNRSRLEVDRIDPRQAFRVSRSPVVRDYVAVDGRGKVIAGPSGDYGAMRREADRMGGYVRFAAEYLRGYLPRRAAESRNRRPRRR